MEIGEKKACLTLKILPLLTIEINIFERRALIQILAAYHDLRSQWDVKLPHLAQLWLLHSTSYQQCPKNSLLPARVATN